jgi:hypothetical protein
MLPVGGSIIGAWRPAQESDGGTHGVTSHTSPPYLGDEFNVVDLFIDFVYFSFY